MKEIRLGNKIVGDGNPCYIIAEIGSLFKNFEQAKLRYWSRRCKISNI